MPLTHNNTTGFFFKTIAKSLFIIKNDTRTVTYLKNAPALNLYVPQNSVLKLSTHLKLSACLGATLQSLDSSGTQLTNQAALSITSAFYNLQRDFMINLTWLHNPLREGKTFTSATQDKNFFNYWWLEREISEMVGVFFEYKEDTRNLLLEYMNVFKPLLRFFPVCGVLELFFDSIAQTIRHQELTVQL